MNTWNIKNGDIALDVRGRVNYVGGANKVVQDLRSWLTNPTGYNKFHTYMGTALDSFVGQNITVQMMNDIKASVRQALNDYMDSQMADLKLRVSERGDPVAAIEMADPSSIVQNWTDLNVYEDYGTVIVRIGFRTFTDEYDELIVSLSNGAV